MPTGILVADLIKSSLRLLGVVASGENPTPEELTDGLLALNDMLENWSTERLSVWGTSNQTFTTVPGQTTYTIGTGGNFNTTRPQDVDDAYCTLSGVDYPIRIVGQSAYNEISIKAMQQPIVERLLYVNEYPFGVITLWPVPSQAVPITFTLSDVLSFPVTLTDTLSGPPGFTKAMRYCLAVELGPEFGTEASPTVMQVAADSKGDYKRANLPAVESRYDAALVTPQVALYQRGY